VSEAAVSEVAWQLGYDLSRKLVSRFRTVPEEELALGRQDERRVGDDEIEALAFDGREEITETPLDVANTAECSACSGELERPGIDVDCHDAIAVTSSEERLNAAAGPEVECRPDGAPCRQARECDGARRNGRDMVLPKSGGEVQIVDDEEIVVWLHAHVRANSAPTSFCELALDQQLYGFDRENVLRVAFGDPLAEIEQANERPERLRSRQPVAGRNRLCRREAGRGLGADRLFDGLTRVARLCEERAKRLTESFARSLFECSLRG
jgi:hypothetical protein